MGTKIADSGVGTIASDESASLAALHLQIGRGCSTPSTSDWKNFHTEKPSASQQSGLYKRKLTLFILHVQ